MSYTASNGDVYKVVGNTLYYVDPSFSWTAIQTITTTGPTPTSMADNGLVGILVDGSQNGYAIDLSTRISTRINAGNTDAFYGADRVDYVDTFFLFNRPGTNQWYVSLSEVDQDALVGGPVVSAHISAAGSGYTDGVYYAVPFTGAHGKGFTGTVTVSGGAVTIVTPVDGGSNFRTDDVITASLGGQVTAGTINPGGLGYIDGTYVSVAFTGGSGVGFVADVTVSGGSVVSVANIVGGVGYVVGEALTAPPSILGSAGSGFSFSVTAVAGGGSGFKYQVDVVSSSGFDPLDIAAKTGWPDPLATGPVVMHREVWLIGTKTSEVWYNAGAADFAFAAFPGVFIEHGCIAPWSVVAQDINIYWLSQDKQGRAIVVTGAQYTATRISTHAIEEEFQTYATISDAVGFCYQQEGHVFYQLNFPTANKTWVWDAAESLWHERAWIDSNGMENRHRSQTSCNGYGATLQLDWQTGALYQSDENTYTDVGQPIKRLRSFPHLGAGGKRQFYSMFMLDVETGTTVPDVEVGPSPPSIPTLPDEIFLYNMAEGGALGRGPILYPVPPPPVFAPPAVPQITMRYSDTRGQSWGEPTERGLGTAGQYFVYPTWYRQGYGRDRVFEVSYSVAADIALNGAYIDTKEGSS